MMPLALTQITLPSPDPLHLLPKLITTRHKKWKPRLSNPLPSLPSPPGGTVILLPVPPAVNNGYHQCCQAVRRLPRGPNLCGRNSLSPLPTQHWDTFSCPQPSPSTQLPATHFYMLGWLLMKIVITPLIYLLRLFRARSGRR